MRYAIVIEKAGDNYSAYAPDLPGCIAIGSTQAEAEAERSRHAALLAEEEAVGVKQGSGMGRVQ